MKNLPVPSGRRAIPDFRGFGRRVFGKRDAPEPVSTWRMAPEAELAGLSPEEKKAYASALLPLVRTGPKFQRKNLRRLYQLFSFMDIPAANRLELLGSLDGGLRAALYIGPGFTNRRVRRSLAEEAELFASNASSQAAYHYAARLRVRLNVNSGHSRKLSRLLEMLTEIENRAAALLGKRGHLVRLDDRRLEILKKSVAAIGVPSAVLFPLGTIGLSAEGITTGLVALGGGFVLPAGIAMVTGLGAAVAIGITTKKLLDMLMPTVDADRASIDVQQLGNGIVELERLLNEVAGSADFALRERARNRITEITRRIVPLSDAQRRRIEVAFDRARILGERYLASLKHDCLALQERHAALAEQLALLLDLDGGAIASKNHL